MDKNIINVLEENFIPYAGEILLNNLPSVCDGLLPVHKKVMYALYKNGVTSDKSFIKMLRASAMAMTYYVYGDLPLTGAMKQMGNNCLNYMYLEPKGSFGDKQKKDGVGASSRYIECKLSKYSEDMMKGLKKNCVPTKRNFDNTEDEPIVLPSMIPNVLTNTSQSIAVGEASKIPAHNLIEVCDSFISYLNTKDIDKSIELLKGADLSLGGQIIYDKAQFEKIYKTGKGSFTLLGKYKYDEKENKVSVIEIPYETYIEVIEEKLRLQYDKGNFKEIVDIHDGSDKDGIRLDIYLKKGTNLNQFISKLRKYTPFESKMSCNFTLIDIDNKTPLLMSLEDIIVKWTTHRKQCLKRELEYDIEQYQVEQNKLLGLQLILSDLDKAIRLIRSSKTEKESMSKLITEFKLNDKQAEYIATIRLVNMNEEWLKDKVNKLDEIDKEITIMSDNLKSEEYYKNRIISDLEYVKKTYGIPRKTEIIEEDDNTEIKQDDLIDEYNCQVVLTKEGYIKKTLKYSDNQKLKDGDMVLQQIQSTNKSKLLLFGDKANCYYVNVYNLDTVQPSTLGSYLPTLLGLDNEKVVYMASTLDYSGYMLFTFKNGKVAKIDMKSYEVKTNRSKVVNAYNTDSELVGIDYITKDNDYIIKSNIDKVLIFNTSQVNSKGTKSSQGVAVMKSKNDSYVNSIEKCNIDDESIVEYYKANIPAVGKYNRKDI
jgi:DNA gyrase/topoisomerase IV subunit A